MRASVWWGMSEVTSSKEAGKGGEERDRERKIEREAFRKTDRKTGIQTDGDTGTER